MLHLQVDVDDLGGGGPAAVERGLELDARRALGAGRDELQPVCRRVVLLRERSTPSACVQLCVHEL